MLRPKRNALKRSCNPTLDRATNRSVVKKQCEDNHPDRWTPSERFWETLPRIYFTHRALAEHDRRNRQRDSKLHTSETAPHLRRSARLRELADKKRLHHPTRAVDKRPEPELRRFARGGGPDLTSIRGCPDPTMSVLASQTTPRTMAPSKRSTPYDRNYETKLNLAGVFKTAETDKNDDEVMPTNYDAIMHRLNRPRKSLSPSRFTEQDFRRFRRRAEQETSEPEIMKHSMATIEGSGTGILTGMGVPFNNLKSFDPNIAWAVPDLYDGAPPSSINRRVFNDLGQLILPNTDTSRPAAPNFFMEVKGQRSDPLVGKRQAAHVGAIGARGMMSLQSYPSETPQYNGNAYSFTNTYQDGQLKMYTTHATAPKESEEDRPSYHMTQLNSFAMTGNSNTFRQGATFYRNARDLAKEYRDSMIKQANQAAQQTPADKRDGSSPNTTTMNTGSSRRTDSPSRE